MPRTKRMYTGGLVCHVLNRAVGRATIFRDAADYAAFENLLLNACELAAVRLLTFCLMPNHWHLVLWPHDDGDLSTYMHRLTMTHTMRWHHVHGSLGTGPLYQGRFKSFPVDTEEWRWSGLWHRRHLGHRGGLSVWPVAPPSNWIDHVNEPQTEAEMEALRQSMQRGIPFGSEAWQQATAGQFGIDLAPRPRGRPRRSRSDCDSPGTRSGAR